MERTDTNVLINNWWRLGSKVVPKNYLAPFLFLKYEQRGAARRRFYIGVLNCLQFVH